MSVELQGFDEFSDDLKKIADQIGNPKVGLNKAAIFVVGEIKKRCPVDKGGLRDSYNYDVIDAMQAEVGTIKDYAPFVEYPTRPHIIKIKNRKVLSDTKQIFGTKVKHPGTKGQPHFRPAIDENEKRICDIVEGEIFKGI